MIENDMINCGIDYILEHLDEDISIEDVANYCNFSKYHFSRMFKKETGESLYSFIKRLKINQSAIEVQMEPGKSITDIGLDYGYSSTNYSSVFKNQHSVSPAKYRENTKDSYFPSPFYQDGISSSQSFEEYDKKIEIRKLDNMKVIYERYIGNYIDLKDKWKSFIKKYSDYLQEDRTFVERSFDDPSITNPEQCICDMCAVVLNDCTLNNTTIIQGGKYAVYTYKGSIELIYATIQGMFHSWLANSCYKMSDRYSLNIYHVMDINNMYIERDICIPIK